MNDALLEELRKIAGEDAVLTGNDVEPYVTDWRGVFHGRARAVVRPSSTQAVANVVRSCAQNGTAIVPQGGNTGLAAGATPVDLNDAIVLSLSRMRSVRALDPLANTITVDAGCVLSEIHDAALEANRFFPLSLAAEGTAQIGGLIATNAGGTAVLRYGTMRALVLGLEAVLPDGRILDGMRALRKDNAGYDWKQLFIGSEGTLGVITGAVLRLFPKLAQRATALLSFPTLEDVLRAFESLQEKLGDTVEAYELFSDVAVGLRVAYEPGLVIPMERRPWYLLVEAASTLPGVHDAAEAAFATLLDEQIAADCVLATSSKQADALWEWRETISENEKRTGPSVKHDVSVPISDIPEFVSIASETVKREFPGTRALVFGHVGDGNVHFNVLLPADESVPATRVNAVVHALVAGYRGSITAEHGIGRYRRDELPEHRSPAEMDLMRTVKHAIDRHHVMNPGAVL